MMILRTKTITLVVITVLSLGSWNKATKDTKLVTESFAQPTSNKPDYKRKKFSETKSIAQQGRSRLLDENRDGIEGLWRSWYTELEKLADHRLRHEQLPDFSWFSPFRDNKTANLKTIRKLSERLLVEFKNPEVEAMRTRYFELKSKINDELLAARKAAEDSYQAPKEGDAYFWEAHRGDYVELKKRKEQAVKEYRKEQQKVLTACHDKLLQLGIELTPLQVEQLFKMSSGDLMVVLFSTFAQLNLLGDYVTEKMREAQNGEDYAYLAKRYYAVYVSLVSLTLDIHEYTREKLLAEHLPRLDNLSKRLSKVIQSTRKLIKSEEKRLKKLNYVLKKASEKNRAQARMEITEAETFLKQLHMNLKVQRRAQEGTRAYRAHVIKQTEKIKVSARKITRRLKIAFNTYQTVLIGTDQFDLMREGLRDLFNLQKVQIPAMVPLAGERITEHLDLITRHFEGDERLPGEITNSSFKR
jgi:hypothetical protein